jgi:glutathione-independent formaldehyde dehydrogenase
MAGNGAIAYIEPGKVEVQTIDYPKLEVQDGPGVHPDNVGRKTPHGAILKIVATNICGSDQHARRQAARRRIEPDAARSGGRITQ